MSLIDWNNHLTVNADIDVNIKNFLVVIWTVYKENFPLTKQKLSSYPWITPKIKWLVHQKNIIRRRYAKTKNRNLFSQLQMKSKALKVEIDKSRNNFFSKYLSSNSLKMKWAKINQITGKKTNTSPPITSLTASDFTNYFSNIFSGHSNGSDPGCTHAIKTIFLHPSEPNEVFGILNKLKRSFTRQENDLPLFLWREISSSIVNPITFLVNQMIATASYPNVLKMADVIPIFKSGNKKHCNNYRPIAMLHNLSKVFEKVILNRLQNFSDKLQIIPDHQFGFRTHHSTKDAIMYLTCCIDNAKTDRLKTCAVFLDLSKAFDYVDHKCLFSILSSAGFGGHCLNLLKSFLENRYFRVKYGKEFSEYSKIENGVPQGSILSPFLYNLYVSKLQNFIPHRVIQYADDTTILVNYRELRELNILLKELSHKINVYFNGLGLLLNIGKTQIMLIGEKKVQDLCFNGVSISSSTSVKFLGIMIDSSIYFNSHAHFITLKLRKMFYTLYNIRKFLDNTDRKLFFNTIILPHIIYASPFLLHTNKAAISALTKTYNRSLKILFKIPFRLSSANLPSLTGIPSLTTSIKKFCLLYLFKIFYQRCPPIIHSLFKKSSSNFILKRASTLSFYNHIACEWNNLPRKIKATSSFSKFKEDFVMYCSSQPFGM